jgi:hypothetical protein
MSCWVMCLKQLLQLSHRVTPGSKAAKAAENTASECCSALMLTKSPRSGEHADCEQPYEPWNWPHGLQRHLCLSTSLQQRSTSPEPYRARSLLEML